MNNLPLKIFYTLQEASAVLNERFNCTEVNEDYFLHLAMKGEIRLGIFADPRLRENVGGAGVVFSEYFEFEESDIVESVKTLHKIVLTFEEAGSILILNSSSAKNICLQSFINLKNAFFDNLYSIDLQELVIHGKLEDNFSCCQFFDKLQNHEIFDFVYYSDKKNAIHHVGIQNEHLSFPEVEEHEDWKIGTWFNDTFDFNQNMEDFQSEREIHREDCLILGEDIALLLNGKKREPVTKHPRKRLDPMNKIELNTKLHPKRQNSINQIIYGLAHMAKLDLSQHQSAYNQFDAFCSQYGIEIPAKDTCGNLFKDAHNQINFSNSK